VRGFSTAEYNTEDVMRINHWHFNV
jgi:hypothetical protein